MSRSSAKAEVDPYSQSQRARHTVAKEKADTCVAECLFLTIPRPADMSIISIGVGFFLNASFATMLININMANTTIEIVSIYSRLDSLNFIICKGACSSLRSDK